jgi:putative methyltransferase (TIGR04325 family)
MSVLKDVARDWLPPALVRWLCRVRGIGVSFDGDFATWEEARANCTGYDAKIILEKVLAATLKVKHGTAAFERDSVLFDEIEYAWPMLAGLMWAAASTGGRLNVLDFGGALGSSYFQNRNFLRTLNDVRWSVIEQPHFVEAGQKHLQDERLRFYKTVEECLAENQPNVILLSSVLQYLEAPINFIRKLNMIGATYLVIDRTPFTLNGKDRLVVQEVPAAIYSASYPMWIFSLPEFKHLLVEDWSLVASNISPEGYVKTSNGFGFYFQGILLESRQ